MLLIFGASYNLLSILFGCGGRTRTYDLWVMSPTSYQLLHPAMLYIVLNNFLLMMFIYFLVYPLFNKSYTQLSLSINFRKHILILLVYQARSPRKPYINSNSSSSISSIQGSIIEKVVPFPKILSISIFPLCSFIIL